jgi:hypothetical protein
MQAAWTSATLIPAAAAQEAAKQTKGLLPLTIKDVKASDAIDGPEKSLAIRSSRKIVPPSP